MNSNYQNLESDQTPEMKRYVEQAHSSFSQGDVEGAIANFQNAISLYPQCAELYTERANFRQHKLRDLPGALEDYNQAISIQPKNAFCYFWRSQIYRALGDQQKAIEDYNTAMNLAPDGTVYIKSK